MEDQSWWDKGEWTTLSNCVLAAISMKVFRDRRKSLYAPDSSYICMKLIDTVDESINVVSLNLKAPRRTQPRQDNSSDSHASVKFSCDIGDGRKAIQKKNVKSSPSTLNGAMRDDGWWQYTLQQKMCFLSTGPPPLVLGPPHSCLYHGAQAWEPWSLQDPIKLPSPNWELSPWAPSTFWAPLLGLWPGAAGKHRETVEVFSYDVACRMVLI